MEPLKTTFAMTANDLNQKLIVAAADGNGEAVARLLDHGADPLANGSCALFWAACNGHANCVKLLAPLCPKARNSATLGVAIDQGQVESFKLLIPWSSPLIEIEAAPQAALDAGHAGILSAMLACEPRILDKINLSLATKAAIAKGQIQLAALLLSIVEHESIAASSATSSASRLLAPLRL